MDPEPKISDSLSFIEDTTFSLPPLDLPLLLPLVVEEFETEMEIKTKTEINTETEITVETLDCTQISNGDPDDNTLHSFPIDF